MKNLILFSFFLAIISCENCDHCDDQPIEYEYTIKNNSGAKVEIIPYVLNSAGVDEIVLFDKITIEDSKNYTKNFKDLAPYDGFSFYVLLKSPSKIDIVFNNTKKITYQICNYNSFPCIDPKNIFSNEYNNETTETYTVKASDFQNAVSCNGNCY